MPLKTIHLRGKLSMSDKKYNIYRVFRGALGKSLEMLIWLTSAYKYDDVTTAGQFSYDIDILMLLEIYTKVHSIYTIFTGDNGGGWFCLPPPWVGFTQSPSAYKYDEVSTAGQFSL